VWLGFLIGLRVSRFLVNYNVLIYRQSAPDLLSFSLSDSLLVSTVVVHRPE